MTEKVQRLLAVLIVAVGIVGVIAYALYFFWDSGLSAHGYIAFGLGVFFTMGLGFGLMWLVFYSSRKGFDEIEGDEGDQSPGSDAR